MISKGCMLFELISKQLQRFSPVIPTNSIQVQSRKYFATQMYYKCSLISQRSVMCLNLSSRYFCIESGKESAYEVEQLDFERVFEELTVEKYKELIKSEEDEKIIKNILDAYEYNKYTEECVPSTLNIRDMKKLMTISQSQYSKYFRYLNKNELLKLSGEKKKVERRKLIEMRREKIKCDEKVGIEFDKDSGAPIYGLWRNSMYINLSPSLCRSASNPRLLSSLQFSPPLIFDFNFDHEMTDREISKLTSHIKTSVCNNRLLDYPFNMWFCNYKRNTRTHEFIERDPNFFASLNFLNITEKSYLDLFPRKKLIYLTADSPRKMKVFDPDAIYILGAVVDLGCKKKMTLEKARAEGLKTLRLPLDDYLLMRKSKDLFLNEMVSTLHEQKITGNWNESLKHVNEKRIMSKSDVEEIESRRLENIASKLSRNVQRMHRKRYNHQLRTQDFNTFQKF